MTTFSGLGGADEAVSEDNSKEVTARGETVDRGWNACTEAKAEKRKAAFIFRYNY